MYPQPSYGGGYVPPTSHPQPIFNGPSVGQQPPGPTRPPQPGMMPTKPALHPGQLGPAGPIQNGLPSGPPAQAAAFPTRPPMPGQPAGQFGAPAGQHGTGTQMGQPQHGAGPPNQMGELANPMSAMNLSNAHKMPPAGPTGASRPLPPPGAGYNAHQNQQTFAPPNSAAAGGPASPSHSTGPPPAGMIGDPGQPHAGMIGVGGQPLPGMSGVYGAGPPSHPGMSNAHGPIMPPSTVNAPYGASVPPSTAAGPYAAGMPPHSMAAPQGVNMPPSRMSGPPMMAPGGMGPPGGMSMNSGQPSSGLVGPPNTMMRQPQPGPPSQSIDPSAGPIATNMPPLNRASGPMHPQPHMSQPLGPQPGFGPPAGPPGHGMPPPSSGPQYPGAPPPPAQPHMSQYGHPPASEGGQAQYGQPLAGPPASQGGPPQYGQPYMGTDPTAIQPSSPGSYDPAQQTQPGYGYPPGPAGAAQQRPLSGPAQAQRRLDPDQIPSPIQVIEDDRNSREGLFQTEKGVVPPLVTTKFTTQDQGVCSPRYIRSTMYNVPVNSDMLKTSHIPFVLTISPFAKPDAQEQAPPVVDLGEIGPVRCTRCKAYMNSFMQFIDGGKRFQCAFCSAATDVPNEYFNHLDHTGRRVDWSQRAELCLGSYEFVGTKDYCKNGVLPKPPAYIFMIDVSYNSVKSGLVQLICSRLKEEILINLPREAGANESEVRVGFVTYSNELHFYNVKGSLAQPQMLVVSDLEDMFVPLLDGFLVKMSESEAVIDSLLAQIPAMFAESRETEIVLGPVIQAGLDAMKAAECPGKLFIFHSSLPTAKAPGKLKNRDDRNLLGTDKEKTLLSPNIPFYTKLGHDCVAAGCSVDLFLFPNSYIDVASISDVCRFTSGNMYKYSYFQADLDGDRFMTDLKQNIERPVAFDAIMRVRTSTGIRPVDFYGNFFMSNTTDVELACMDCDQSVCVEIKHDDKLSESDGAFVQVAVLFTSVSGQRRLRIHNLALHCCTQMADLFRSCELDALVNFFSKQALRNVLHQSPKQTREHIMTEAAHILSCYRKNCANSQSNIGQLILPECMKLLPLYANCIIKSDAMQAGSEISTDDRSYLMYLVNGMDVKSSNVFFYPRLIPVFEVDPDTNLLPLAIRCSQERLQDHAVYLLENGLSMFLWIGHSVNSEWVQNVFGVQSVAQVDIDQCSLLDLDTDHSRKLRSIIESLRSERHRHMKLTIVRQRDKLEPWFNHFLVEDKGTNGSASYVDFLVHIHRDIRNLLS